MNKRQFSILIFLLLAYGLAAQQPDTDQAKKRLDFARSYFELGGNFTPSFQGMAANGNGIHAVDLAPTMTPYLKWGGFHFWGHADFYVMIPLGHYQLGEAGTMHQLTHSVVTGGRWYPWAYRKGRLRPFLGLSWSALDLQQGDADETDAPVLSRDFIPIPELGLMAGTRKLAMSLSLFYFHDRKWAYPVSRFRKVLIETPALNVQVGLRYHFESSKTKDEEANARWNAYPGISAPGRGAKRKGDFFVGAGPSSSFSLARSEYNRVSLPWLNDQLSAPLFLEVSAGYQWNKAGLFAAAAFRNPSFETQGYGAKQSIRKTSVALEVNKYLTDFTGFAPYIGLNLAYDHVVYQERSDQGNKDLTTRGVSPGLTFGWDIIPGKAEEYLILRTNLRWFPFNRLAVGEAQFNFSQLEYNLIQAIFYPGRFLARRKGKG